ncbi:phosphotransferase family protein [Streptomyces sp. RB6PN25]|uniref:Phosphotransferase family protein n=1 Tax=Streptomyces humicola TaxID=2953240 RepID=A0ABT1Q4L2_9ACTN|nr:phosphotransferase family protein [Streptomyces humicola]MCQ4083692.1 phosphotransferase family protein [Streptomyces humicola]
MNEPRRGEPRGTPTLRRTTRDPEDLARRLTAWVTTWQPAAVVTRYEIPPSNGMSSETILFDLQRPGATPQPCVLRLAADPLAYSVFPRYDMARQYRTIALVAERTKVPVPRLLRLETDPGPLGALGFVMERACGRVPPDVLPYTYPGSWLYEASAHQRDQLERSTVDVLAELHTVPAAEARFLTPDADGDTALRRHVNEQRAYYTWVIADHSPSPLIEHAFARLEELWPEDPGESVLSWGDARIGNIVYAADFTPSAVLDWEMASVGPRELDLGWLVFLHRFFQDLTERSGHLGLPGFLDRDRVAARYARQTGHAPRDMEFYSLYAALRHALVMLRVGYRRVHFGEIPMPADTDSLILHRSAIEDMLEGRYW